MIDFLYKEAIKKLNLMALRFNILFTFTYVLQTPNIKCPVCSGRAQLDDYTYQQLAHRKQIVKLHKIRFIYV